MGAVLLEGGRGGRVGGTVALFRLSVTVSLRVSVMVGCVSVMFVGARVEFVLKLLVVFLSVSYSGKNVMSGKSSPATPAACPATCPARSDTTISNKRNMTNLTITLFV